MRIDGIFAADEMPAERLIGSDDPDVIDVTVDTLAIDRAAQSIAIDRIAAGHEALVRTTGVRTMNKRDYGGGTITQPGDAWRLRYRVGTQRHSETRSKVDAVKRPRELLKVPTTASTSRRTNRRLRLGLIIGSKLGRQVGGRRRRRPRARTERGAV